MRGRAADQREISDDLPADGNPTSPTSAMTFSSRRSECSSTCSPRSWNRGTRRCRLAKAALPASPAPARGHRHALVVAHEVGHHRAGVAVADHGADRHRQDRVLPLGAGLEHPLAVAAVLAPLVRVAVQVQQRGQALVGLEHDVAAAPAVTAVGTAAGHVGLAAEGGHAVAPAAAAHVDGALVDELGAGLGHRRALGGLDGRY